MEDLADLWSACRAGGWLQLGDKLCPSPWVAGNPPLPSCTCGQGPVLHRQAQRTNNETIPRKFSTILDYTAACKSFGALWKTMNDNIIHLLI